MKDSTILFEAMLKCATKYDPIDITMWSETKSLTQMADDIAKELHAKGYHLTEKTE